MRELPLPETIELDNPIELADADLDTVSGGLTTTPNRHAEFGITTAAAHSNRRIEIVFP